MTETEHLDEQVYQLRRSNTILLEALMDMVNQFYREGQTGSMRHEFLTVEEAAVRVLIDAGFATEKNGGYELLWDRLTERRLEINQNSSPSGEPPAAGLPGASLPDGCDEMDAAHWDDEGLA